MSGGIVLSLLSGGDSGAAQQEHGRLARRY